MIVKDKLLFFIISFFIGWLGIDRFLRGQIIFGILKLITFGGFGIWWLIDWIVAALDFYHSKF